MSRRIDGPAYRTTDHSDEISELRAVAGTLKPEHAIVARAAADLLEVHDATGISLDDWAGPRDLVNLALVRYTISGAFLPNGV